MSLKSIYTTVAAIPECQEIVSALKNIDPQTLTQISLKGLSGSMPAFVLAAVAEKTRRSVLCLFDDAESASYFHSDLQQVLGREEDILLLPFSGRKPFDAEYVADPAPGIQRTDILEVLDPDFRGIVVADLEAIMELVPSRDNLSGLTQDVFSGGSYDPEDLIQRLVGQGFSRVEFVERPGELALRGGILDVFPFTGDHPVRLEFFGDEIESIREFDIHSQRSISRRKSARLVPDLDSATLAGATGVSFFEYLNRDAFLCIENVSVLREHAIARFEQISELLSESDSTDLQAHDIILSPERFGQDLNRYPGLHFGSFQGQVQKEITFSSAPQPAFNSSIALLRDRLIENHRQGIKSSVLCDTSGQEGRIHDLLEEDLEWLTVDIKRESLHEGFEIPSHGIAVYTDHQIFNRYHRPSARRQKQRFGGLSLRELHHLVPGDFVVHIDYGIGRFAGMQEIDVTGRKQEVLRIVYQANDVLYVNVNALYKLHKYTGKEGHQPKLTRLGSDQWEKAKSRTKSRLKDIARDLIKLYAQRKQAHGHAFPPDTIWQRELEASFEYEDTPDQASASEAVKADMSVDVPMDRLVCGDVGFGKTEIAIRAAFKAVQDGKQVAVLVPTTVLAMQHFRTFSNRLNRYPVKVHALSRMISTADIKESIRAIKSGEADIVVGTHRLISKDIHFKDLGLLIVDEEQRFGVGVKEKLRKMRVNVDTLTLTATPIPRTLQFSLLGARDLSIIATPPLNRQPIVSEIHTFDKDLIRDAILFEVKRGGQVFFIHNRVQSINDTADSLRMLIPDVRFGVGHGQMKGPELERVMSGFYQKKFDVLVSTSIIENGLDVANANTIIIDRADRFGLAELHQLRGRVGRSSQKAFCYLLVPSVHGLTREAKQRLQVVEEFTDLGSGFHIAMRDLDIRGAGNLLGAEQSGFVDDVGFDAYHKILDEAVEELRNDEFSDLFDGKKAPKADETSIEVDADALIPESYLSNRVERLNMYRLISDATDETLLEEARMSLADRFGPPPVEVENLLLSMEIKMLGQSLRLSRVVFKNQRLFLVFPDEKKDPYFYQYRFQPLLGQVENLGRRSVLKESKAGKLRAIIQDIPELTDGRDVLKALCTELVLSQPETLPS